MTRVLLTGFEPFGGAALNSSWEAVRLVADGPPDGLKVTVRRLSCVFGRAVDELSTAVRETGPDLVVHVGQADGRSDLGVERIAINIEDARIPDNTGRQPVDRPVVPGGPAAHFATLPVKACVAAVREAGLPASLSHTAGTFISRPFGGGGPSPSIGRRSRTPARSTSGRRSGPAVLSDNPPSSPSC